MLQLFKSMLCNDWQIKDIQRKTYFEFPWEYAESIAGKNIDLRVSTKDVRLFTYDKMERLWYMRDPHVGELRDRINGNIAYPCVHICWTITTHIMQIYFWYEDDQRRVGYHPVTILRVCQPFVQAIRKWKYASTHLHSQVHRFCAISPCRHLWHRAQCSKHFNMRLALAGAWRFRRSPQLSTLRLNTWKVWTGSWFSQ